MGTGVGFRAWATITKTDADTAIRLSGSAFLLQGWSIRPKSHLPTDYSKPSDGGVQEGGWAPRAHCTMDSHPGISAPSSLLTR